MLEWFSRFWGLRNRFLLTFPYFIHFDHTSIHMSIATPRSGCGCKKLNPEQSINHTQVTFTFFDCITAFFHFVFWLNIGIKWNNLKLISTNVICSLKRRDFQLNQQQNKIEAANLNYCHTELFFEFRLDKVLKKLFGKIYSRSIM